LWKLFLASHPLARCVYAHDAAEEVDEKSSQEGDRKEGREALFCVNRGSQSSLKVEVVPHSKSKFSRVKVDERLGPRRSPLPRRSLRPRSLRLRSLRPRRSPRLSDRPRLFETTPSIVASRLRIRDTSHHRLAAAKPAASKPAAKPAATKKAAATKKPAAAKPAAAKPAAAAPPAAAAGVECTYLEFVAGNSAKFWRITMSGTTTSVTNGKIGSNGQAQAPKRGPASDESRPKNSPNLGRTSTRPRPARNTTR